MAAPPFSSSRATLGPESSPKAAQVADKYSYNDGILAWDGEQLKDDDIIIVIRTKSAEVNAVVGYTIYSLEPANASEPSPPTPFKLKTTTASNLPELFLDKHIFKGLPAHLKHDTNRLNVLISTLSGTGLSPQFFDEVLEPLLGAVGLKSSDYNVTRTQSTESVGEFALSELLIRANNGKKQSVLMLSGDGGMVDTINGLLESGERSRYVFNFILLLYMHEMAGMLTLPSTSSYIKPILSQLPLGTGNALFHSLHKPSPLPSLYIQGLRTLLHGAPRPLPIFRATFSPGSRALTNEARTATPLHHNTLYGAVVASYGLHATLVADSDTTEYRKHGDKRFRLVANDLLNPPDRGNPHAYQADVTLIKAGGMEEMISRKEHGYILSSLVSNLEKTFTISPASEPLDGQLRVVHFGPCNGEETMEIMKAAYNNGTHVGMEEVGYESVDGLRINFLEKGEDWKWRRCCIDGLIVAVEEGGWMEVRRVEDGSEAVEVVVDA
jgi:diacylglycerol kinase family enzyme